MDLEAIDESITTVHRGKKWILTTQAAADAEPIVEQLRESDSGSLMIVAAIEGVGGIPAVERIYYTRRRGDTVMKGIRAYLDSIEYPGEELLAAVDAFDPDREAMNLLSAFSRKTEFFGRPIYGARPAEWGALEDKMLIDELCDEADIARAPSELVAVGDAPSVADRLATELGTVWVADNTEGWHGGGEYVRWVRSTDDFGPAVEWFSEHAETVRVTPFLDGVSCSIHGFNTGDGTAVFLPVELMIFHHAERREFVYGQAANFWDPPEIITDQMRDAGQRMGSLLNEHVGYLGAFGIDGVATVDGFFPTELNPRMSVGHGLQARAADVPLGSMQRLLIAGDLDVEAAELEETIVSAAETSRGGGMLLPVAGDYEPAETGVAFTESGAIAVDIEETSDATMRIGQGGFGSIIIMRLDPERNPIGPRTAPKALQTLALAQELWGIDVPPVRLAPDPF